MYVIIIHHSFVITENNQVNKLIMKIDLIQLIGNLELIKVN